MNIIIYTKSNCPNCVAAKRLLDDKGIGYTAYDVEDPNVVMTLEYRQMPQIFIEGQRVGGLAGLQAALKQVGL